MDASLKTVVSISVYKRNEPYNIDLYSQGSGVAVWREKRRTEGGVRYDVYVATAAHVIDFDRTIHTIILSDVNHNRYVLEPDDIMIVDREYDYGLVRIKGKDGNPDYPSLQIAAVHLYPDSYGPGDLCYVIGYPFGKDANSISHGTIRSHKWTATGTIDNMLVSAPSIDGNSGGGVFLQSTGEVVGIVSSVFALLRPVFGFNSSGVRIPEKPVEFVEQLMTTFVVCVSTYVIRESIFSLIYSRDVNIPVPYFCNQTFVGMAGFGLLNSIDIEVLLQSYGNIRANSIPECAHLFDGKTLFGCYIKAVIPGSPAYLANIVPQTFPGNIEKFYILWAVSFDGTNFKKDNWILISEENPLSKILHGRSILRLNEFRTIGESRAIHMNDPSEASERDLNLLLDISPPLGDVLHCLISEVITVAEVVTEYRFRKVSIPLTMDRRTALQLLDPYLDLYAELTLPVYFISNLDAMKASRKPIRIQKPQESISTESMSGNATPVNTILGDV